MFPRGRMYSDQVGQWSPKDIRTGHSTREAVSHGNEVKCLDKPAMGGSHCMHSTARGFQTGCATATGTAQCRTVQDSWWPQNSPVRRRPRSRSSISSNRRSIPLSPRYNTLGRLDSPAGAGGSGSGGRLASGSSSASPCSAIYCGPSRLVIPSNETEWNQGRRLRDVPNNTRGQMRRDEECSYGQSPPASRRYRNRGGGVGVRGRLRQPFSSWSRFGGRVSRQSRTRSSSVDSEEEHRRSRSREKGRRRRQVTDAGVLIIALRH